MKNILENIDKSKIIATILIILLIVSVLPMKGTEVQDNIITLKPQTKLLLIPQDKELISIEIISHKYQSCPTQKPNMSFQTTDTPSPETSTKRTYTEPLHMIYF